MHNNRFNIAVTGDAAINSFLWNKEEQNSETHLAWKKSQTVFECKKGGAVLFIGQCLKEVLDKEQHYVTYPIIDIAAYSQDDILRGFYQLKPYKKDNKFHIKSSEKVFRVSDFLGYKKLYKDYEEMSSYPKLLKINEDSYNHDILVIDDEGNGFCDDANKEYWPMSLERDDNKPIIIYKTDTPINCESKLHEIIKNKHLENTVIIFDIEKLRTDEINISKQLSWEKTSEDLIWNFETNDKFKILRSFNHVIIRIGLEGAVYYKNVNNTPSYRLFYHPSLTENNIEKELEGSMPELTSCFIVGFVKGLCQNCNSKLELLNKIENGIKLGITVCEKYFITGFCSNPDKDYPNASIFESNNSTDKILQDIQAKDIYEPQINKSYRVNMEDYDKLEDRAKEIVKYGQEVGLFTMPNAQFGDLKTIDREEIESFRSIQNLLNQYILSQKFSRPLSIAVFGTPGSGKSFGITQVAMSIDKTRIKKLEFNMSQFRSLDDLNAAFHKIRDASLSGKFPLAFFDEFDSTFEGVKRGWLKYFLAPMQDGEFKEGDTTHPIGRAIFVFAGGTSSTYEEFIGDDGFSEEFKSAKIPDFISRLRGFVNIKGPNPINNEDRYFIIRRAMLLRSLIERKAANLLAEQEHNGRKIKKAQVDERLLDTMLKIDKYKHGARSMEALLDMSILNNEKMWTQSCLPPKHQLKLHVDEEEFHNILMGDSNYNKNIEEIAKAISYDYERKTGRETKPRRWSSLSQEEKELNIEQARFIYKVLLQNGFTISPIEEEMDEQERFKLEHIFNDDETAEMSRLEHERWYRQKQQKGWKYAPETDSSKKENEFLMEWEDLGEKQERTKLTVKDWPRILANAKFKVERRTR